MKTILSAGITTHCQGRSVKGINFLTALYLSNDLSIPVTYQIIAKKRIIY